MTKNFVKVRHNNDRPMTIKEKLKKIDQELNGKISSGEISLVAVSKYAGDEEVLEAYQAGQRDFAENYIIPALKKIERLGLKDARWHLIGPIQKNKINKVTGNFHLIQSVHNQQIAELINKKAADLNIRQKVLIQINCTGDKSGFRVEEFRESYPQLLELKNLEIQGLMTMGFPVRDEKSYQKTETIYKEMRQLIEELQLAHPGGRFELSMGMSNDYSIAASCGATIIRLGSAIFQIDK